MSEITRRGLIGGGLATALLAGCAPAIKLIETPNLTITEGNIHPVTYKTQEEGERDIGNIVNTMEDIKEEGWLFVQVKGADKGMWVDVGERQKKDSTHYNCDLIEEKMAKFKAATAETKLDVYFTTYHFHSLYRVLMANKQLCEIDGEYYDGGNNETKMEVFSIPSIPDIHTNMKFRKKFDLKFGADSNMHLTPERVIVPTGRFIYETTPLFNPIIDENKGLSDYGFYYSALATGIEKMDVNATLDQLRHDGVNITYEKTRTIESATVHKLFNQQKQQD